MVVGVEEHDLQIEKETTKNTKHYRNLVAMCQLMIVAIVATIVG